MTSYPSWIAVDWGTSNLRVWGVDAGGNVVGHGQSGDGMGRLTRDQFAPALERVIADAGLSHGDRCDVLVCGMAGARQGWVEAPYLDAPADLRSLALATATPDHAGAGLSVRILPGVCQKSAGREDVMRGEETQLLGLSRLLPGFSGLVCMPGTHAKWARLEGTRLTDFSTSMTGEVFEVLSAHSVLRHSLKDAGDGPERDEGFDAGLEAGLGDPSALLSLLFKARSAALLSGRSADWCAGYLSGVLIGADVGSRRAQFASAEVPLIGAPALCALYERAILKAGGSARAIDAQAATLAGLKTAQNGHVN